MEQKTNNAKTYPLSAMQKQFWLLNQMHPNSSAYNIPSVFRIMGTLNILTLEKSINEIISRHGIFRTYFASERDQILQHVVSQSYIHVGVDNYYERSGPQNDDDIKLIIESEVEKPFDLSRLPLIRVKVVHIAEDESLLFIIMHHIITDLRTKDLFAEELKVHYDANINNKPVLSSGVHIHYADYSKWQAEWLENDEHLSMLSFWKKQLEGKEGILELPLEKTRPAMLSQSGKTRALELDSPLTDELKVFCRKSRVNVYLTLLTVYFVLLYRYSGQKELTVGVPLTNRRGDKHKNTMGCFVNIIPLTLSLSDDMSFSELLRNVRRAMLGAHRNQEVPFVSIVNEIKQKKDASHNPLFQAGFTFEHPMNISLTGVDVESVYAHSGGAQLDIFATFWETGGAVQGVFEYNTELFDNSFTNRFADSYILLLKGIIRDSGQIISRLALLPEKEINKIHVEWNSTKVEFSDNYCVHTLFEKQVEKSPNAVAVQFQDESLSYSELNRKANQIAFFLGKKKHMSGDLIGIYMDRSLEMLVALLGVLKAGATYVPIDPEFPEDRIRYMISHSQVSALLTQGSLKQSLPEGMTQIYVESDWNINDDKVNANPDIDIAPDSLAYVIYTSGSTGNPKGVQVQHGAVANFLNSMADSPGMCDRDVLLAVTTLSFDIAVLELFLPLVVGGKTVIASRDLASDGTRLLEAISNYGITLIQATPVTFRLLIQAGWKGERPLKVLCGGEAMPVDLAGELVERSDNVWNMYGPTETTVWSTCCKLTGHNGSVSVGKPIANTRVYILDKFMQPVPVGVAGDLFIGGAGVTKGYLNQPELTNQKFVANPFSKDSNEKIYNTGDIAKYKRDGNLELMGRSDFQLKIRGFRIEAGEIETVLDSHRAIALSAVCAYSFGDDDLRLIAYYTSKNDSAIYIEDLRSHLAGKLPEYMIPSMFIQVDTMPLTPNGKVDKKNLPQPENKRPELEKKFISPQNQFEQVLCDIWAGVLKTEGVGVNDKFFEIGGTSFLGVQVIGRINKELNIDVPVVTFYQYPTIRSFAGYLKSGTGKRTEPNKIENRAKLRKKSLLRSRGRAILKSVTPG